MSEVADALKKIVAEHLGCDGSKVTPDATFIAELGVDSLEAIELLLSFERVFDVEISDEAAVKMITLRDAIDYIEQQQMA
jgi:acyl carrier protein